MSLPIARKRGEFPPPHAPPASVEEIGVCRRFGVGDWLVGLNAGESEAAHGRRGSWPGFPPVPSDPGFSREFLRDGTLAPMRPRTGSSAFSGVSPWGGRAPNLVARLFHRELFRWSMTNDICFLSIYIFHLASDSLGRFSRPWEAFPSAEVEAPPVDVPR